MKLLNIGHDGKTIFATKILEGKIIYLGFWRILEYIYSRASSIFPVQDIDLNNIDDIAAFWF